MTSFKAALALAAATTLAACAPRMNVYQPALLRSSCSVAILPIMTTSTQREYKIAHFPSFHEAMATRLQGRIGVREPETVPSGDLTWEAANSIGRGLGADAVVGFLMDDSEWPPRKSVIIKVLKTSNGKALAQLNWLVDTDKAKWFNLLTRAVNRVLSCQPASTS